MIIKDEILKKKDDFSKLCKNHKVKYLAELDNEIKKWFE